MPASKSVAVRAILVASIALAVLPAAGICLAADAPQDSAIVKTLMTRALSGMPDKEAVMLTVRTSWSTCWRVPWSPRSMGGPG
jgi:hypothetical protein